MLRKSAALWPIVTLDACCDSITYALIQSALGEAIERTLSHYQPRPGDILGSFNELHNQHPLVDPLRFPRRTIRTFLLPNMTHLSRDSMLRCTEAENLSTGEKVYLPSAYVYMPHSFAPDEHWVEFSLRSGLTSGATDEAAASETLEAAALKSLDELVGCMHYGYKIIQAKTPPILMLVAEQNERIRLLSGELPLNHCFGTRP